MGVKRNPLPGRSWRILAHYRDSLFGESVDIHSREYDRSHRRHLRALVKDHPALGPTYAELRERTQVLPELCEFDELVIDDWLHLEQMDTRSYWMSLGDAWIWISIPAKGDPIVTIRRGEYGPVKGETEVPA